MPYWPELFCFFQGTGQTKFTDEQVLNPDFVLHRWGGVTYCRLCDKAFYHLNEKAHMKGHERELRAWRKLRSKQTATVRAKNLAAAREAKNS